MSYAYTAYDRAGAKTTGVVSASSEHEAMEQLRRDGLYPTRVERNDSDGYVATSLKPPRRRHKLLVFTLRQLSVLISTGTPVVDALAVVERQTTDDLWRAVLGDVRARVEEGCGLGEAMAAHPVCFGSVCRSLIAAGENAGNLNTMLDRAARLIRRQQRTRSAMIGAMIYPALLITVSTGVLTVMMVMVMPKFGELFETLDAPVPASTALLFGLSEWVRGQWWVLLGIVIALVCGTWGFVRSGTGVRAVDHAKLHMPLLGGLHRSIAAAQIARVLGVLLASKVQLLDAIELTRNTLTSHQYQNLLTNAAERVTKGEHLSAAFAGSCLIPSSMTEALHSAERSGSVAPVLNDLADFFEEDNEMVIKSLTTILEPVILIVLGVMVAFIMISIFLPLFDITASAAGG